MSHWCSGAGASVLAFCTPTLEAARGENAMQLVSDATFAEFPIYILIGDFSKTHASQTLTELTPWPLASAPARSRATRYAPVDRQFPRRSCSWMRQRRGTEPRSRYPAPAQPCRAVLRPWQPRSDLSARCIRPDTGSFVQIGVSIDPGVDCVDPYPIFGRCTLHRDRLSEQPYASLRGAIPGQTCRPRRPATSSNRRARIKPDGIVP